MKGLMRLILPMMLVVPGVASAGKNLIMPSYYKSVWGDTDFALQGKPVTKIEKDDMTPGIAYRYLFDSGLAVGGEFAYGPRDFTAIDNSFSGYLNEAYFAAIVGYVFRQHEVFQPYIEGGVNETQLSLHSGNGGPNAKLKGLGYVFGAGFNVQFSRVVGMRFGYQQKKIDVDDDTGSKIETNADVFMLSVLIRF